MPDAEKAAGVGWLLAFDLGRRTGFAAAGPLFRPLSPLQVAAGEHVIDYQSGSFNVAEEDERFRAKILTTALGLYASLIETYRPKTVIFESILLFKRGDARARMLIGLASAVEISSFKAGVRVQEASNSQWRKHFDGAAGKTNKPRTVESCRERGYGEFNDFDRADATGLLDFCAVQFLQRAAADAARARRIAAEDAERKQHGSGQEGGSRTAPATGDHRA